MTATERLLWKLGEGLDRSPYTVALITVTPLEHRQLYEASPGVLAPYTSVNWTQTTLRFRGIPVKTYVEMPDWAEPGHFKRVLD